MHHYFWYAPRFTLPQAENGELPSGIKPTLLHYSDLLALDCAGEDSGMISLINQDTGSVWVCAG